jgi:hypothetical protein
MSAETEETGGEAIDRLYALLAKAKTGEGPGILVLVNTSDTHNSVFTVSLDMQTALEMAYTATNLFDSIISQIKAEVPEGSTFH